MSALLFDTCNAAWRMKHKSMQVGGRVGSEPVHWFNGDLFNDDDALALGREEIETAGSCWPWRACMTAARGRSRGRPSTEGGARCPIPQARPPS